MVFPQYIAIFCTWEGKDMAGLLTVSGKSGYLLQYKFSHHLVRGGQGGKT